MILSLYAWRGAEEFLRRKVEVTMLKDRKKGQNLASVENAENNSGANLVE